MKILDRIRYRAFSYSGKYLPSREKFKRYLVQKYPDYPSEVAQVLEESKIFLMEENNLSFHLENYVGLKKGERYIKTKLLQKLFSKDLIQKALLEHESLRSWDTYSLAIEKKILAAISKGKGNKLIVNELCLTYPSFNTEIKELVATLCEDDISTLQRTQPQLPCAWRGAEKKEQQKMFQKLLAKGYSFDTINKFFRSDDQ